MNQNRRFGLALFLMVIAMVLIDANYTGLKYYVFSFATLIAGVCLIDVKTEDK